MTIYWGSFILQIVAFIILLLLLMKFAYKPLVGMMIKRQEKIEEQINFAENNKKEAEKLLDEQIKTLQESKNEAQQIIERSRTTSIKQSEEILEAAKAEAKRIKDKAVEEIQLERNKAVGELKEQVGALSVLIASKMIEKELDVKEQTKLIDDIMKQVGSSL